MYASAYVFGLLVGLSIGPIAILILNLALTRGARAAVSAGLGAACSDFVWGLVAFLGGASLAPLFAGREAAFKLACAALLVAVAAWTLVGATRAYRSGKTPDAEEAEASAARFGPFLGTFLLTCANPLTAVFFAGFLAKLEAPATLPHAVALAGMIFLGSLTAQLAIALGGAVFRPLVKTPGRVLAVNVVSLALVTAFACASLF